MARKVVLVIDLQACVGCLACVVACLRENVARQQSDGVSLPEDPLLYSRTRPVELGPEAGFPEGTLVFSQCMHCEDAPCEAVCPTGATYRDKYGVVRLDTSKCVGCRACVVACPYGARMIYRGRLEGEKPNRYALEPGYPDKCNLCVHCLEEYGEDEWVPACVEACAFGARLFGFIDEDEGAAKLVREGKAVPLMPWLGTRPRVFYILPSKLGGVEA